MGTHLILYMKRGAVLRLALAAVIKPRRGDICMAEPFLNLADVGFVRKSVGRRSRARRMHAQPVDFRVDAGLAPYFRTMLR